MPFSPVDEDIDKRDLSAMTAFQSPVLVKRLLWSTVIWKMTFAISTTRRHNEVFLAFGPPTTIIEPTVFEFRSIPERRILSFGSSD